MRSIRNVSAESLSTANVFRYGYGFERQQPTKHATISQPAPFPRKALSPFAKSSFAAFCGTSERHFCTSLFFFWGLLSSKVWLSRAFGYQFMIKALRPRIARGIEATVREADKAGEFLSRALETAGVSTLQGSVQYQPGIPPLRCHRTNTRSGTILCPWGIPVQQ